MKNQTSKAKGFTTSVRKGRYLILPLIFLFCFAGAFAEVHKQNECFDLKNQCFFNGTYCPASSICNVTIFSPNATVLVNNLQETNQISFHNYTFCQTSDIGEYSGSVTCYNNTNAYTTFTFDITPTGKKLSEGNLIIATSLAFMFALFLFAFYLIWISNEYIRRAEVGGQIDEGRLAKYKIFMRPLFIFGSVYLILIGISFGLIGFEQVVPITQVVNLISDVIFLISWAIRILIIVHFLYMAISFVTYIRKQKKKRIIDFD